MHDSRTTILAGALLLASFVGPAAAANGASDLAGPLRTAADELGSAASRSADPMKALTEVVGLLSQVAERARLAPDVRAKIEAATAGLRKDGRSAEPAAVGQLNEAYAALNGGRRFSFPAGVTDGDRARSAYQREIDRAAAALRQGRPAEAVKPILEALMLVTTRMEIH